MGFQRGRGSGQFRGAQNRRGGKRQQNYRDQGPPEVVTGYKIQL